MSLLVIPNVLVNGTGPANIVDAVGLNANFTAIATAVNNIYPSQVLPITTAQATFGATATGVGYKFLANDATAVPLTVSAVGGQSADIFDVTLTSAGTKAFSIGSAGAGAFGFALTVANTLTVTTGNITATNGIIGAQQAYMYATAVAGLSSPAGLSIGDIVAQRAANNGRYYAGGSVNGGIADFNILNSIGWSFQNQAGYAPVFGGAYTNASDARLKTAVLPLQDSLASIGALKPVSFKWIASDAPGLGFVAQDVQAVFPDLVSTDSEGIMGVNYDGLIPVCVAAIQELTAQFNAYVSSHP